MKSEPCPKCGAKMEVVATDQAGTRLFECTECLAQFEYEAGYTLVTDNARR